jgi:hypothetical protein
VAAPNCSVCNQPVFMNQRFAAKFNADTKTWTIQHEEHIDPEGEFAALPRFFMSAPRIWVLTK